MDEDFRKLLASIDKLPHHKPLREFAEILTEFTAALSHLANYEDPARALAEVKVQVARIADLQAGHKTGATEDQVRAIVAGSNAAATGALITRLDELTSTFRSFAGLTNAVRELHQSLTNEVKEILETKIAEAVAITAPVESSKGKPSLAQLRKVVLAPVHLEVDVQRNIAGRIERFIVNEV